MEKQEDKTKTGRPPMYDCPAKMAEKAEEYFEELGKSGDPATITGLCMHLGFESRQSFYAYEDKPKFNYTIKRLRLRIENHYEVGGINSKSPVFHIFALKNLGWSDKQEIDHTTKGDKISNNKPDLSKLSIEELTALKAMNEKTQNE